MDCNHVRIDGKAFEDMLAFGLAALSEKEGEVNGLNVFPVPDGDTGSNMRMTYESGLNMLRGNNSRNIGEAAGAFARGMLLGARGNSGVILSQIFKGIAVGLEGVSEAGAGEFSAAFVKGVEKSYKAVVKPVEGTILTVFREGCEDVAAQADDGAPLDKFFQKFTASCERSLARTPEQLAVLKEAGVVDSGGAGLTYILKGFNRYFLGEEQIETPSASYLAPAAAIASGDDFGYCTEFLLELSENVRKEFDVNALISQLESIGGESIVALRDEDIVKVHVHVQTPGDVLNIAQRYGEFMTIKIENMTVQHNELQAAVKPEEKKKPRVKVATVAVAGDDGFKKLFYDMGADCVVSGGQSANPSVEDFLKAFESVNAENIIVLPDNSNVILTAKQAGDLFGGGKVHIVETKNLPQGYGALSIYNPDEDVEQTLEDMRAAKDGVTSMELTRAVRDAHCDGVAVKKDEIIAIVDGKVTGVGADYTAAFASALKALDLQDKGVMTIFRGKDTGEEEFERLSAYAAKNYSSLEVTSVETDQQIYGYIIAIE